MPPDQSDVAIRMYQEGAISGEALRRVTNFDENDAPSPEELAVRIEIQRSTESQRTQEGPPEPIRASAELDAVIAMLERLKEGDPPLPEAAVTAATRRRISGKDLADLDEELLLWVVDQSEVEIDRILSEVAGLVSATDPVDESWLDRFRAKLDQKIGEAQATAKAWVENVTGQTMPVEQESENRSVGVDLIIGGILEAVRRKLFTPQATPDPIDTGRMPEVNAPVRAIRNGLSQAGGGPAQYDDLRTSELIGNGAAVHDELERNGFQTEMMVWHVGAPSHPFDPHQRLAGVEFDSWDSPKLDITLDGQWIGGKNYRPGDHEGCQCTVENVFVAPPLLPGEAGEIISTTGGEFNLSTDGMDFDEARDFRKARQYLVEKYPDAAASVRHWGTGEDALSKQALREQTEQTLRDYPMLNAQQRAGLQRGVDILDADGSWDDAWQAMYPNTPYVDGVNLRFNDGRSAIIVRPGGNLLQPSAPFHVESDFYNTRYTTFHEFGHALEHDWLERLGDRTPLSAGTDTTTGMATIQDAIARAGYNDPVSGYGKTNPTEGFAELFVSYEVGGAGATRFRLLYDLVKRAESEGWAGWNARFPEASMSKIEWFQTLLEIGKVDPSFGVFKQ